MIRLHKFYFSGIVLLLASCSPLSQKALEKRFKSSEDKFQDHIGFSVKDVETRKTIFEYQADRYFTPASNTKIFTLFASLNILGDSIPGLRYDISGDSLVFRGTGDPGFLYHNVHSSTKVFSFLKSSGKKLFYAQPNFYSSAFGPGWAWDDYNDYYSPERSPFPVYGNIFTYDFTRSQNQAAPTFFKRYNLGTTPSEQNAVIRERDANNFRVGISATAKAKKQEIPFHTSAAMVTSLLADTLHMRVSPIEAPQYRGSTTLFSMPADSLYRVMMQESDNFIAEQLLLVCSGVISDSLNTEIAIRYTMRNYLADLKDKPVWVDGSGLSRYNLFTPRSVVQLWYKIYTLVPSKRLFPLLATGGKPGTLANWFKSDQAYLFGKTGSLSNNHCLSGYLITKSGKTLIFSFMNSNFTTPTADVRKNMQEILQLFYNRY